MANLIPIDLHESLEKSFGQESARLVVKSLDNLFQFVDKRNEDALESVRARAEALITQKKFELKNELTKELATKEDLARLEGTLRHDMQAGLGTLRQEMQAGLGAVREEILASKEDFARLEGRLEAVRLESKADSARLEGRLEVVRQEMQTFKVVLERRLTIMFIVLLFTMVVFNPNTVDFVTKIFNLIK